MTEAFSLKISGITNAYNLDMKTRELEISNLTTTRMGQLFDYNYKYKGEVALGELTEEEYAEILMPEIKNFRIASMLKLGFEQSVQDENIYFYSPNENIMLITYDVEKINDCNDSVWNELLSDWEKEITDFKNKPIENKEVTEIEVDETPIDENAVTVTAREIENAETIDVKPEEFVVNSETKPLSEKSIHEIQFENRMNQLIALGLKFDFESSYVGHGFFIDLLDMKTYTEEKWQELIDKIKNVTNPTEEKKELTPLAVLEKLLWDESGLDGYQITIVCGLIERVKPIEREAIINTYKEAQINSINILIDDFKKELPQFPEMVSEIEIIFNSNLNKVDAIDYYETKYTSKVD